MSTMPPIEIRWGGGKWPNAPKQRLRPYVRTALDLAQLGLFESFGFMSNQPMTATVWCVADTETLAGSSDVDRPADLELQVAYGYLRRLRKLPRIVSPLVTAATHELAHLYRFQQARGFDLLEHAASEGISMHAEGEIARALGIGVIAEYDIEATQGVSREAIASMRARIDRDNQQFLEVMQVDPESDRLDELHDNWFAFDDTNVGLPAGYVLGMDGVRSLLTEDVPFATIAHMPAAQILGLE